jgi:hypothetical protein
MKRAFLVTVAFVVITMSLTWFWEEFGRLQYGRLLKTVAPTIYDWIGFGDARVGALRQRYINWIPFVGLVIITPGLAWKRRFIGLSLGLATLFLGHLGLNLTEGARRTGHLPFVPSLISDTLPLILWVIVAFPVVANWFDSTPGLIASEPKPDSNRPPDQVDPPTD